MEHVYDIFFFLFFVFVKKELNIGMRKCVIMEGSVIVLNQKSEFAQILKQWTDGCGDTCL
jgi:hypothetical protein